VDEFLANTLKAQVLSAMSKDEQVARQGIMNHQTACHLMDLSFVRDATEMSIPESYAVQGLASAHLPREQAGLNASHLTPSTAGVKA
jgi:hypothetical protein